MKRFFSLIILAFAFFGGIALPAQANHGSPHCWCYHANQKCEHHSWVNDDNKTPFTCDNDAKSKTSCNQFCAKKGDGWKAIHCDPPEVGDKGYINQNAHDNECAKASQGETGKPDQIKPAPDVIGLGVAIGGRSFVTGLGEYIAISYRYAIGIVAIIAIVMIVYGGFRYLVGSAMSDVSKGKKIIFDALMGLLIVLGAYLILQTINKDTLTLKVDGLTDIKGSAYQTVKGKDRACRLDEECQSEGSGSGACFWYKEDEGQCGDGAKGSICGIAGGRERFWSTDKYDANNGGKNYIRCQDSALACMFPDRAFPDGDDPYDDANQYWFRCLDPSKILGTEFVPPSSPSGVGSPCQADEDCKDRLKNPNAACIMKTDSAGQCSDGSAGSRCMCDSASGGCMVNEVAGHFFREKVNNNGRQSISCQDGLKCLLTHTVPNNEHGYLDGDWACQKPRAQNL